VVDFICNRSGTGTAGGAIFYQGVSSKFFDHRPHAIVAQLLG
jgi:hypothetical protein